MQNASQSNEVILNVPFAIANNDCIYYTHIAIFGSASATSHCNCVSTECTVCLRYTWIMADSSLSACCVPSTQEEDERAARIQPEVQVQKAGRMPHIHVARKKILDQCLSVYICIVYMQIYQQTVEREWVWRWNHPNGCKMNGCDQFEPSQICSVVAVDAVLWGGTMSAAMALWRFRLERGRRLNFITRFHSIAVSRLCAANKFEFEGAPSVLVQI